MNMVDIQGRTNRELVSVCSRTLTSYITEEERVLKTNKVRHVDRLSFMTNIHHFVKFIFDCKYIRS